MKAQVTEDGVAIPRHLLEGTGKPGEDEAAT